MQDDPKILQVEQNLEEWNNWDFIFLCKITCLQLIVEEKILKHRLSSGGVVSTNQGCRQRNICLWGLNQDKGFL